MPSELESLRIKFTKDLSSLAGLGRDIGAAVGKAGPQVDRAGKLLSSKITLPLLAVGAAAAKVGFDIGVEFESAFAGVTKTVSGTTEELAALRDGIRKMAMDLPATTTEIASVAEAAGQLGIQTDAILSFTRTMIDLGETTNLEATEAATALARLANITGLSQDEFDRLGSTVVALGNNLATTEREIVEMGLRIAGAGAQVGLTEAQILSFAGAMSSVGIAAEAGGTAISRVFLDIQQAANEGGKALDVFAQVAGESTATFKKAFEDDAAGAVELLLKGLNELPKSQAASYIEEMGFKGVRTRDVLLRLSNSQEKLSAALRIGSEAWEVNNALQLEAAQRYATTESKMARLKNQARDLGITFFDFVEPATTKALDAALHYNTAMGTLNTASFAAGESVDSLTLSLAEALAKARAWGNVVGLIANMGIVFEKSGRFAEAFGDEVGQASEHLSVFAEEAGGGGGGAVWAVGDLQQVLGKAGLTVDMQAMGRATEEAAETLTTLTTTTTTAGKAAKLSALEVMEMSRALDALSKTLEAETNAAFLVFTEGLRALPPVLNSVAVDVSELGDSFTMLGDDVEETLADMGRLTTDAEAFAFGLGDGFRTAASFVHDFTGTAKGLLSASGPWGAALSGGLELAEAFGLDLTGVFDIFVDSIKDVFKGIGVAFGIGGQRSFAASVFNDVRDAFAEIANEALVMGSDFDRASAEIRVMESAMLEMLNQGIKPTAPEFIILRDALAIAREGAMLASVAFQTLTATVVDFVQHVPGLAALGESLAWLDGLEIPEPTFFPEFVTGFGTWVDLLGDAAVVLEVGGVAVTDWTLSIGGVADQMDEATEAADDFGEAVLGLMPGFELFTERVLREFADELEGLRRVMEVTGDQAQFWADAIREAEQAQRELLDAVAEGTLGIDEATMAWQFLQDEIDRFREAASEPLPDPVPPGGGGGGGTGSGGGGGGVSVGPGGDVVVDFPSVMEIEGMTDAVATLHRLRDIGQAQVLGLVMLRTDLVGAPHERFNAFLGELHTLGIANPLTGRQRRSPVIGPGGEPSLTINGASPEVAGFIGYIGRQIMNQMRGRG